MARRSWTRWTSHEIAVIDRHYETADFAELRRLLPRHSDSSIRAYANSRGLQRPNRQPHTARARARWMQRTADYFAAGGRFLVGPITSEATP